jgi:hypothetical protein
MSIRRILRDKAKPNALKRESGNREGKIGSERGPERATEDSKTPKNPLGEGERARNPRPGIWGFGILILDFGLDLGKGVELAA